MRWTLSQLALPGGPLGTPRSAFLEFYIARDDPVVLREFVREDHDIDTIHWEKRNVTRRAG